MGRAKAISALLCEFHIAIGSDRDALSRRARKRSAADTGHRARLRWFLVNIEGCSGASLGHL